MSKPAFFPEDHLPESSVDVYSNYASHPRLLSVWAVQRARYMTLESGDQLSDDPLISLPAVAR